MNLLQSVLRTRRVLKHLAPYALAISLAACGGGQNWGSSPGSGASGGGGSGGGTGGGAYSLAQRTLPAAYTNAKAINYSPYRAAGPGSEVPTDGQILQDLQLLNDAGFTLLRLFGADAVSTAILRVAQANQATLPNLRFQLGIYLFGLSVAEQATCTTAANTTQIQTGISLAGTYSNVVAVSVGNETSFFAAYMPVNCLKSYITTVKQNVAQPVTADDDYTFYAGQSGGTEIPDTVLPLLDFVSIHTYPFSNYGRWDYQQLGVAAGDARAAAMMNAALAQAQASYSQVATYIYAHGAPAGLPITVGETGWKARVTNPANPLEGTVAVPVAAAPINAKYYYDLMNTWQAGGAGPKTIFYFEAFDEAWKNTDDGWGLWDASRAPRYALCGTAVPSAAACTSPNPYTGAGYYP